MSAAHESRDEITRSLALAETAIGHGDHLDALVRDQNEFAEWCQRIDETTIEEVSGMLYFIHTDAKLPGAWIATKPLDSPGTVLVDLPDCR